LVSYECLAPRKLDGLLNNRFHSAYQPADQSHLNAVGVGGRICQNPFNNSFRQFAGTLILLLNDLHPGARFYI